MLSKTYNTIEMHKDKIPIESLQNEGYTEMAGNLSKCLTNLLRLKETLNANLEEFLGVIPINMMVQ